MSKKYNIIDYQDCIKETSVINMERHFLDLDKFRAEIIKIVIDVLDLYTNKEIGEPIVLSILADCKKRIQKKINLVEVEIPEIANVEFVLFGTLKEGGTILISNDFDSDTKIQSMREKFRSKYEDQLNNNLTLSLGDLLIEIENTIEKIKNIDAYPNIEQWYPQLKDIDSKPNPRLKYHSENYFDTAYLIYRESKKNNAKGLTWPEVYEKIVAEENKLGMENKYSSFDSFDTRRKKYQREQRSSN